MTIAIFTGAPRHQRRGYGTGPLLALAAVSTPRRERRGDSPPSSSRRSMACRHTRR